MTSMFCIFRGKIYVLEKMHCWCILLVAVAVIPALVSAGQDTNVCAPGQFQSGKLTFVTYPQEVDIS